MDREILEARMMDLEKASAECLAQYHQIFGRLQECRFLLEQLGMQELVNEGEAV